MHFVSRIVPDLAVLVGLPGLLLAARRKAAGDKTPAPAVLAALGGIVREGCDSPETSAMRINCGREVSRVAARALYEKVTHHVRAGSETETFERTRERIRQAQLISAFDSPLLAGRS